MNRYFIAGNGWLIFAILMLIGRIAERSNPDEYSFFHFGQWFSAEISKLIVLALFALSGLFFIITWRTKSK